MIKNLCKSLGVFFDLMSEMMPFFPEEDLADDNDDDEGIPF